MKQVHANIKKPAALADPDDNKLVLHFVRYNIRLWTGCYVWDKNPIHLWCIYHQCRSADMDVPAFVLEYLDQVASNITRPSDQRDDGVIKRAVLGNHTRKEAERTLNKVQAIRSLAGFDKEFIENDGAVIPDDVADDIAEILDVSRRTVKSWISEWRKIL